MNLRRFLVVAAVVVAIGALGLSGLVEDERFFARSFTIPSVTVDATLRPDATLDVVERITYDFHGSYTYGTRPIPLGDYRITDLTVTEDGRPLEVVGAPTDTTFFFSAEDERRTFEIRYTVLSAVPVAADVAEVYWQWVGPDHPGIGRVRARLRVPPGPGRLRAWGHGDPDGVVAVDADRVTWTDPDLPAGVFVEGRVAVPVARLGAAPSAPDRTRLPEILAEERAATRAANARRLDAAADQRRRDRTRSLATAVVPVVTLLGVAFFALLYRRYGREPAVVDVGEYVRDLPDDPPAVVVALLDWGRVDPRAIGATVLDLARRGHLRITEERTERTWLPDSTDHVLERRASTDPLLPHERLVLDLLFAEGDRTTQSAVLAAARTRPSAARGWLRSYRSAVEQAFRAGKYQVGDRGGIFSANLVGALVVGGAAAFALRAGSFVVGAVAGVAAVALAVATLALRQRTPAGARRAAEWRGVRRFLRDFSALDGAPAGHLALYERYLVAAVALDVADDLARRLAVEVPEATERVRTWYVPGPGPATFAGLAGLGAGLGRSFSSAATPRSSGGGGGGGFSGGGGGGGGGGGIGAG